MRLRGPGARKRSGRPEAVMWQHRNAVNDGSCPNGQRGIETKEPIVTDDRGTLARKIQQGSYSQSKPAKPIYGIPAYEVLAWVQSWATDNRLPTPKTRRIR